MEKKHGSDTSPEYNRFSCMTSHQGHSMNLAVFAFFTLLMYFSLVKTFIDKLLIVPVEKI